jgi:hypothetical protein
MGSPPALMRRLVRWRRTCGLWAPPARRRGSEWAEIGQIALAEACTAELGFEPQILDLACAEAGDPIARAGE